MEPWAISSKTFLSPQLQPFLKNLLPLYEEEGSHYEATFAKIVNLQEFEEINGNNQVALNWFSFRPGKAARLSETFVFHYTLFYWVIVTLSSHQDT